MSYCWEPHHNLSLWCAEPGISMAKFHLYLLCCWMVQGKVTNTVLGSVHLILSRESNQIFLRPCWCFNPQHNLLLSPGILKGLFCQRKQKKIKQTQPWDGLEKEVLCFPGSSNDLFFSFDETSFFWKQQDFERSRGYRCTTSEAMRWCSGVEGQLISRNERALPLKCQGCLCSGHWVFPAPWWSVSAWEERNNS